VTFNFGKYNLVGDVRHILSKFRKRIVGFMPNIKMPVRSYRDLVAWQKAMELVVSVYACTQTFPKVETYGLISQMRRAAVSVPSNIAEGHARISIGEFRQFLGHALGSLVEIETQILIGERPSYLDAEKSTGLLARTSELGKILSGLLRSMPSRR
jgi:four helix bundle protein